MPPPRELLPELTSDILLRLPAKSLLRFRCLSNSICEEIGSSNFVETHHKRSIETRSHRKLIFHKLILRNSEEQVYYAADIDDGLRKAHRFAIQFSDRVQRRKKIIGICHGLILLSIDSPDPDPDPDLFLWNPSTRESKKLPLCPDGNSNGSRLYCGLGYDSALGDYKVVRIFSDYIEVHTPRQRVIDDGRVSSTILTITRANRVWVFSLKSNSWKRTHQDLDLNRNIHINLIPRGFANGFLYWPYVQDSCIKAACFDLANEEYLLMPDFCLPHDQVLRRYPTAEDVFHLSIAVMDGKVVLSKSFKEGGVDEFYEIGAGGYWSKVFTFKPPVRRQRTRGDIRMKEASPLAYSKDGACVLLHIHKDIFWYNIDKGTRRRVACLRGISKSYPFECSVYLESIVPLGNDGTTIQAINLVGLEEVDSS